MTDMTMRQATDHDVDAIVALWRQMAELHARIEPLAWTLTEEPEGSCRSYISECVSDEKRLLVVAVRQGCVVGYLMATESERPPVLLPRRVGVIHECCIAEGERRKGVATCLVKATFEWFESRGLSVAEVGWASGNPMSSAFWPKQGFTPYQCKGVRRLQPVPRAEPVVSATQDRYFASIAEAYDRLQPLIAGPSYQAGLGFVLDLIPHQGRDAFICVELGCGTATLSQLVLDRFPSARVVAVDGEPAMLEVARRKLARYGKRAEVREGDIATCEIPNCDVALSSFTFHHLPPEKLGEVLGRVAAALSPGGCVILLDTINVGPRWGAHIGAQSRRLYERHVAAAIAGGQATEDEIDARWELKRRMKEEGKDVEYRHHAEDLVRLMQEAAFAEVGLVWRMFASTIVMGFVG